MAEGNRAGSIATDTNNDRPAIHVSLAGGLDDDMFRWVAIGAEEEGVPCRRVDTVQTDPVAGAYEAAMSSRFGIGVGLAADQIVVHELHMPAQQPVLTFEASGKLNDVSASADVQDNFKRYCRLAGGNAARLIIRLPLRFEVEPESPVLEPKQVHQSRTTPPAPNVSNSQPDNLAEVDPALVKAIARVVVRLMKERGMP